MCRLSCRNYRRERDEAICRLSCLSYCGADEDHESWTPPSVPPHKNADNIAKNYKVCPKCKHSSTNTRYCLHCGHHLRWASLPALPDLSLFSSKKNATQAGQPVASPNGGWRRLRQSISAKLKGESDDGIQNILRSCGNCNRSVNYADICNRFCPECGWPLSLTSTALDKYTDVVRAGPHQQGRRRIRSMIFNQSSRTRQWELGAIEEKEIEEDDGIVELEQQFQYPELHPKSMPSFADLASVAQPLALTNINAILTTPPRAHSSPHSTSSGEMSGETLIAPHGQVPGAFCFDSSPRAWSSFEPRTPTPSPKMAYQPKLLCQKAFVSEPLLEHHSGNDLIKGDPMANGEVQNGDVFCTPSRAARPSSFELRVIQSLVESLNVDPMAVASAAVHLHEATHGHGSERRSGPPFVKQEQKTSCNQWLSAEDGKVVALRGADGEVVNVQDVARAIKAGYFSTKMSSHVPVEVQEPQPECLREIADVNAAPRGDINEKLCIPASGEVQSPEGGNAAWI